MTALRDLVPRVFVYGIDPLGAGSWFVLGHATRGRLGTTYSNVLSTSAQGEARADITPYVEHISIRRGKSRGLDSYGPSTCALVLDVNDRRFDPFSVDTTAYSPASLGIGRNLFERGRRLRVALCDPGDLTTPQFWLWSGFVDTIAPEYAPNTTSSLNRTTVTGVDGFDILGRTDLAAVSEIGAGETVGPRIRRICARAGWIVVSTAGVDTTAPKFTLGDATLGRLGTTYNNQLNPPTFTTAVTTITNGVVGYGISGGEGAVTLTATSMAQPSLTDIKLAVEAEGGQVWINRAGQIQYTTRADQGGWPLKPPGRTAAPQA